jgi:hypothetical protein
VDPVNEPGAVIPDGKGGVLASYLKAEATQITIADVGPGGVAESDFSNLAEATMVLGDRGTAFATDGQTVVAFDVSTLQPRWAYSSSGGALSFINATSGGGVAINDSQLGVIQLDSTGSPSTAVSSLLGGVPLDLLTWQTMANGELAIMWDPEGSNGITTLLPQSSPSPSPHVNPQGQGGPPFCQVQQCSLAPIADTPVADRPPRNITYGVYSFKNDVLIPLYNSGKAFEIILQEQKAAQNTDNNADTIICTSGNALCNNRTYAPRGEDYSFGKYTDQLIEPRHGVTLAVTQNFSVSRQPVHVFWPTNTYPDGSPWSRAKSLTTATTTAAAKIYLNGHDQEARACQPGKAGNIGCDKTAP